MRNPEFHRILAEMAKLHDSKNADYANDADPLYNFRRCEKLGIPAWVGAIVRAEDKLCRLETFVSTGNLQHEGVEDTLIDAANYFVLALVLYRETAYSSGKISSKSEEELRAIVSKARVEAKREH